MAKYTAVVINLKTGYPLEKIPRTLNKKNEKNYQLAYISPNLKVIPQPGLKVTPRNLELLRTTAEKSGSLPEIKQKLIGRGKKAKFAGRYELIALNSKGKKISPKPGQTFVPAVRDTQTKKLITLEAESPQVFNLTHFEKLSNYIATQSADKLVVYETAEHQLRAPDKKTKLRAMLLDKNGKEERSLTKAHFKLDTVEIIKAEAMQLERITPDKVTNWFIPRECDTLREGLSQHILSLEELKPGERWQLNVEVTTKIFGEKLYIPITISPDNRVQLLGDIEGGIITALARNGLTFSNLKSIKREYSPQSERDPDEINFKRITYDPVPALKPEMPTYKEEIAHRKVFNKIKSKLKFNAMGLPDRLSLNQLREGLNVRIEWNTVHAPKKRRVKRVHGWKF